jgi:cytochrome b subunit of formate dehydrogenase
MIKKPIFGLMWFVIIFMVSYLATGIIVVFPTISTWSKQAVYEATHAFRNNYLIFFAIGSLILTMAGTVTGVLPGTKRKAGAKKRTRKTRKR